MKQKQRKNKASTTSNKHLRKAPSSLKPDETWRRQLIQSMRLAWTVTTYLPYIVAGLKTLGEWVAEWLD